MRYSAAVNNVRLAALETTAGASAKLQIRSGPPASTIAGAAAGTLLDTIQLPSDWLADPANQVVLKSGTWQGTGAVAAGYAGHYRVMDNAGTTCHADGYVGMPWAALTAYVVGQQVTNGAGTYKCVTAGTSAGSVGPTGTGSAISDGSAAWDYLAPSDMVLDNSNIAINQIVTITAYQITAGNT